MKSKFENIIPYLFLGVFAIQVLMGIFSSGGFSFSKIVMLIVIGGGVLTSLFGFPSSAKQPPVEKFRVPRSFNFHCYCWNDYFPASGFRSFITMVVQLYLLPVLFLRFLAF